MASSTAIGFLVVRFGGRNAHDQRAGVLGADSVPHA
jgi:hypothetical protein